MHQTAQGQPILLIDELPYTVLNSDAGKIFMDQMREWRQQKTIIMISHRDDHIRQSDKALGLLNGGRFIHGAPDKVIRQLREESYNHFVKRSA